MEEIQERLDNVEMKQRHLASIKKRAEAELTSLKERQNSDENVEEVAQAEIEHLERFIEEASIRAGEAITGKLDADDIIGERA